MNKNNTGKFVICISCKKEYYSPIYRLKDTKFCSRDCQLNKQFLDENNKNKKYNIFIEKGELECRKHGIHKKFKVISDKLSPRCIMCSRENTRKNDSKYWFRNIVRHCKARAKRKNLIFNISEEFIESLLLEQKGKCALSGIEFIFNKQNLIYTPSVDRIDSNKGYIPDNVQLLCRIVNRMKTDLEQKEFIEICKKITINNQKYEK